MELLPSSPNERIPVLIIDVDGCLYHNDKIHGTSQETGLIARGIHRYCQAQFGISAAESDALYSKYGDTLVGLEKSGHITSQRQVRDYFGSVFGSIHVASELHSARRVDSSSESEDGASYIPTGIEHTTQLQALLRAIPLPKVVASNSPEQPYVQNVLAALQLTTEDVGWSKILTPQSFFNEDAASSGNSSENPLVVTKTHDRYWQELERAFPSNRYELVLFDDSSANLAAARRFGLTETHLVQPTEGRPLHDVILEYLGCLAKPPPPTTSNSCGGDTAGVAYLAAKDAVDEASLNKHVEAALVEQLRRRREERPPSAGKNIEAEALTVVDIGAGCLSMLPRVGRAAVAAGFGRINYCAVELQPSLATAGLTRLKETYGFTDHMVALSSPSVLGGAQGDLPINANSHAEKLHGVTAIPVSLSVIARDLTALSEADILAAFAEPVDAVDLVVACSFADLLPPRVFAVAMSSLAPGALLYLPITFAGGTRFADPASREENAPEAPRPAEMPSDEAVAEAYHQHLIENEGQFIDTDALVAVLTGQPSSSNMTGDHATLSSAFQAVGSGFVLLSDGRSDWRIDPSDPLQEPMWDAMLRFIGRAVPSRLWPHSSFRAWLRRINGVCNDGSKTDDRPGEENRCRRQRHLVLVENRDLLLAIPARSAATATVTEAAVLARTSPNLAIPAYDALFFTAPRTVQVRRLTRNCGGLEPGHVELQTVQSMISTGTELKFFRGTFAQGESEALDATIEALADQGAAGYPMQYGYSLVGLVVGAGRGVDLKKFVGRLAFSFQPHVSACVVPVDGLMLVPRGIDAADAVFLPAMETALCIAHDAHPRAGESVVVFGQGLIGLLVTAILARCMGMRVTAVDGYATRRKLALRCGAVESLAPETLRDRNPPSGAAHSSAYHAASADSSLGLAAGGLSLAAVGFDVSIEVTGNPAALDAAVSATRPGGRCVVASWCGGPVQLSLGTAFHRSHVSIVASQVSELPGAIQATWTKERRFDATWQFIRDLRPSNLLSVADGHTILVGLEDIKRAYDLLDTAGAVTARVLYHTKSHI